MCDIPSRSTDGETEVFWTATAAAAATLLLHTLHNLTLHYTTLHYTTRDNTEQQSHLLARFDIVLPLNGNAAFAR
jgi:hypothetical protein